MKIINSLEELIEFLGPTKDLNVMTPQFERDYDLEINFIPQDKDELNGLIETAPKEMLIKMGVGVWFIYDEDCGAGPTYMNRGDIHYLFPGEWYEHLPNGFEVVDINGEKEKFIKGESDNDIRFGCLPYGFVRSF